MKQHIQELVTYAREEDFDLFAEALHTGLKVGHLQLSHIGTLLEQLQYAQFHLPDEDDEDMEYTYLSLGECIRCCAYFAVAELKKLISDGVITKDQDILTRGGETLDLSALNASLDQIAEDHSEALSLKQHLMILDRPQNMMQWRILDKFRSENAALSMHVVYYLRNISSPQELQNRQKLFTEDFSMDALATKHASIYHSRFCYQFCDCCSYKEIRQVNAVLYKQQHAATPRNLILTLAEYEMWLGNWLYYDPALPFTVYSILADDQFPIVFCSPIAPDAEPPISELDRQNEAIKDLLPKAEAGDAAAQNELGRYYLYRQWTARDSKRKGVYWIRKAADQGLADAQLEYGIALQKATGGLSKNYEAAVDWLYKAAQQENATAQRLLSQAYASGNGTPQDLQKATFWRQKAARNGDIIAQIATEHSE